MDSKQGKSNLKKYRTYNPASSNPSTGTNHAVASTSSTRTKDPFLDRSREPSQPGTPRPLPLVPPRIPQRHKSDSGRSTPSMTTSRSNPPPTTHRTPAPAPLPTLGPRVHTAQMPVLPPEQPSQHSAIFPLLAVIKDQQTAILTQNATFDLSLRDLVAELGKLNERVKQKEEDSKEKEAKDKAKEDKEKAQLNALTLLAQGVDDVRKRVIGIEDVVGVSRSQNGDKTTVLDRLRNIEMSVDEWLERARDPDAGIAVDRLGSIQPPTPSSLSPTAPSVVRHEMAVSPIKLPSQSQAGSTRTPEPLSAPKPTMVDVSTQVDTSDEPPTIIQELTESDSLCVSCSNKLHSPIGRAVTSIDDIEMSDSISSAPSQSKGKEVDRSYIQDFSDDPFLTQPDFSLSSLATSDARTSTQPTCEHSSESLVSSHSEPPPENQAIGSFSAVDWRKTPTPAVEEFASLVPSTITPSQNKSYSLPPLQEGTVAALRNEVLVDPYPYPLESTGLGDGNGLVLTGMAGIVGASVEAAERMPSPESLCEEDNVVDNVDDNPGEPSTPVVCDTQLSESRRSTSGPPTPQPNAPAMTSHATESTPTRVLDPVFRKSVSVLTESSLTALSSDSSSNVDVDMEASSTPRPPSPEQVQKPSIPIAASQTSNITEDEDTVVTLVMDAQPTSPAGPSPPTPLSQTTSQIRLSASPLVLVTPEPGRTRPTESPEDHDDGDDGGDDDDNLGRDKESLTKLQEWYREQRVKVLNKEENKDTTPAAPEVDSNTTMTEIDSEGGNNLDPATDNPIPILDPPSPLFTPPNVSPRGPEEDVDSTNKLDDGDPAVAAANDDDDDDDDDVVIVSGNDVSVSPLFTSSAGVTPPKPDGTAVVDPVQTEPPAFLKKLVEIVKDDDADIVPLKRNRISSTRTSLVGSKKGKEKPIASDPQQRQQSPKLKVSMTTRNKRQPSKAKTRIKKRKVSQEPTKMSEEEEDEDDQPPLKRVKLRLGKAPTPSGGGGTNKNKVASSSSGGKLKSVTLVSPVKTPMRRARGQQPRSASVVWPKVDKPIFDQFIECDICEQWYHVGCVGIHPDDIRLSASEIYRCPPCEAGVSKEALTPVQNSQGNKHDDDACARPKCLCPRRKKSQILKTETTFIVESFVGMVKKAVGGRGIKLVYLVKWHGYDFEDATWEEEAAMGLPNPGFFVEKFEEQARKEGIDLSSSTNSHASLLKCAVEAGWKPNGVFVRKEGGLS